MAAPPANARSRRTRAALLDATRDLIEEGGVGTVTMAGVAERAGVTRRSVYLHFGSRADLIGALFDHVADTAGLWESLAQVFNAPDSVSALDAWAGHLAGYARRLVPIDRAIRAGAGGDEAAEAHRRRADAGRLESCRKLTRWLEAEGNLAPGWTASTAADALAALSTSDFVEGLLVSRRWSNRMFRERVGAMLRASFVG